MPVITVIDRKITDMTRTLVSIPSQKSSARNSAIQQTASTNRTPRMCVDRVKSALRVADASEGGGGSAPDSGSVTSLRLRRPGQNSSRRKSAANGSAGLMPCAIRLAGGR